MAGVGNGLDPFGFQLCQHEVVEFLHRPGSVLHRGGRLLLERLKGPVVASFLDIDLALDQPRGIFVTRVGGTHLHPLLERGNFRIGKLSLGRHFHFLVADRLDQQALVRIARDDRRTVVAAHLPALLAVQHQPALNRFGVFRMALVAMLHQQRADFRLEELQMLAGQLLSGENCGRKQSGDKQGKTGGSRHARRPEGN